MSNDRCFGVPYAGADPECCLLESCGATTGVPALSVAYLDRRAIAKIELKESLRFIDLVSDGGARQHRSGRAPRDRVVHHSAAVV